MLGYPLLIKTATLYLLTTSINGTEKYLWNFTESTPNAQVTEQVSNTKKLYIGGSDYGLYSSMAWNDSGYKYNTLNGSSSYLGADTVDWTENSSGGDFEIGLLIDFTKLNSKNTEQVIASKYRSDSPEYKSWFISHVAPLNYTIFTIFYNNNNGYVPLKIHGLGNVTGIHLLSATYEQQEHRTRIYLDSVLLGEKDDLNLGTRNNNQNARFLLGALADSSSDQILFANTSYDTVYFQDYVDTDLERVTKTARLLGDTIDNGVIQEIDKTGYGEITQTSLNALADSNYNESVYYWKFNGTESRVNYTYNGDILANSGVSPTPFSIMPVSDLKQGKLIDNTTAYNFFNGHQALKNANANIIFYTGSRMFGMWVRHASDATNSSDYCYMSIYKYPTFAKKLIYFMQDSETNKLVLAIWYDDQNHAEEIWIDNPILDGKYHFIGGGYSLEDNTMFMIVDNNIYTKDSHNLWKINTSIVGTDAAMTIGTYYREDGQTLELLDQATLDSMIMIQKPFTMSEVQGILNTIRGIN